MTQALDVMLAPTRARYLARTDGDWEAKCQRLVDTCHPKQRAFVLDKGRRVSALCGRGCGKTTGVLVRLARRGMSTKRAQMLYIATTRDQAIELLWNPLKDLIEDLGLRAIFNETSLRCTFVDTGAVLRLVGANDKRQIEKYRGMPFHEVWIDEAASYPVKLLEHLIERVIGPRLGDYNGMLGMVGTPGHILTGEFYDGTRPGSPHHRSYEDRDDPKYKDWKGWSRHAWSLEDGAEYVPALKRLLREAYIQKEAKGWSDKHPVWLREYMGQWAADDTDHVYRYRPHDEHGNQWNQWIPEVNPVTGFAKLPAGFEDPRFVYGMDFGHTDPTAINIFAYSLTDPKKRLIHVYSFEKREMYLRKIAEILIGEDPKDGTTWPDHDNPGGCIGETGYPDGCVADPKSLARGYIDELNQVYGIQVKMADQRSKFESIELTNGDLIDGRILVMKGSSLEDQLLHLQWKTDDFGKVKEDPRQRNDACDTLIYARREAHHLLSLDAPQEKGLVSSPYSDDTPEEFESDDDFGDVFGGGEDYWG